MKKNAKRKRKHKNTRPVRLLIGRNKRIIQVDRHFSFRERQGPGRLRIGEPTRQTDRTLGCQRMERHLLFRKQLPSMVALVFASPRFGSKNHRYADLDLAPVEES